MRQNVILVYITFFLVSLQRQGAASRGLSCIEHPGYRDGLLGPLVQSWEFATADEKRTEYMRSMYLPRISRLLYQFEDRSLGALDGLDWFFTNFNDNVTQHFVTLHLQRDAMVYMLVPSWAHIETVPSIEGWESVGFARMSRSTLQFGVHEARKIEPPTRAYVFRKIVIENLNFPLSIDIPSAALVSQSVSELESPGNYIILLSEVDGSASKPPTGPNGELVESGTSCPDWLHDLWVSSMMHEEDKHSTGKLWRTWHPLWDPCYWCSYDHEHGSSAQHLMGYTPRFEYAAWKNYQQKESHGGFKGYVLRYDDYYLYFNIHSHLSKQTRYETTHHSVVLAITDANTKELLAEVSVKANFGNVAARTIDGGTIGLLDTIIEESNMCRVRHQRLVNVIDPENLDPRILQNKKDLLRGEYEQWRTELPCSTISTQNELLIDIKDPTTAMRSTKSVETTMLGEIRNGAFLRHSSLHRALVIRDLRLGENECKFTLNNIHGTPKDGVFYTDPYGKVLLNGPGPTTIRQYIKPGFNLLIRGGEYEAADTWLGMYKVDHSGAFRNIGYGVDPDAN